MTVVIDKSRKAFSPIEVTATPFIVNGVTTTNPYDSSYNTIFPVDSSNVKPFSFIYPGLRKSWNPIYSQTSLNLSPSPSKVTEISSSISKALSPIERMVRGISTDVIVFHLKAKALIATTDTSLIVDGITISLPYVLLS